MEAEHQLELIQNAVLGIILILSLTVVLALLSKKTKFIPYTVLLVLVGVFIKPGDFPPLDAMRLSPGLIFYIVLPILLFESAFNFDYTEFRRVFTPAFIFATLGLLICAFIIAIPMSIIFGIDFISALLFGSVISSTDPIAVLAIFKELGVPKKLQLLVDAESFLNDGTSVIMFKLLLGLTAGAAGLAQTKEMLLVTSAGNFVMVLVGGAAVGLIMGWLFAQIISSIKNNNNVEIILTLILATSVFMVAEHFLHVSGIIAVLLAGLILGNYGRSKISPKVSHEMHQTWSMLVFVFTSIVFLLIGYEIHIFDFVNNLTIILATILFLLIGRSVSIYLLGFIFNLKQKPKNKISWAWMHIINIGGLRGSLPLVVLLLLPDEFIYKELFIDITLGIIFFTLIINATFIRTLIDRLDVAKLSIANKFEMAIVQLLILEKVLKDLEKMHASNEIRESVYIKHKNELTGNLDKASKKIDQLLEGNNDEIYTNEVKLILDRYCLNIEKSTYKSLYKRNVIDEGIYRKLLSSIKTQEEDVNNGFPILTELTMSEKDLVTDLNRVFKDRISLQNFANNLLGTKVTDKIQDYYIYHKARLLGNLEVIEELKNFPTRGVTLLDKKVINNKIDQYKEVCEYNKKTLTSVENLFPDITDQAEDIIFENESDDILSTIIHELGENERISDKVLASLDLKI